MKNLQKILENMKNAPVLVVGDIMLDRFVYGNVDRISPESPVPVLAVKNEERMLGGAGNALANLAGLGVKAQIVAVTGDDDEGALVKQEIEKLGFSAANIVTDANRPTTVKSRFLAGHQQLLRTDFEHKSPLGDVAAAQVRKALKSALQGVKAVILSDYGKGLLSKDILEDLIKDANAAGVPVIVDPKGQDFSIYKGATAVTPNKKELADATKGHPTGTDEEVEEAANQVIDE